jgi:PAS domain S-box-containing protein
MSDSINTGNTQFLRMERTEAALRLSEATKTAILETALDCIVTIDHRGFVVDWNPAAERTFGHSLAEAVGREMCDLIIPERFRGMHRQGLTRAVMTGKDVLAGQRIEISALRKNGEEFPVELSITRIASDPTPLFTGHIRDISRRKKWERDLRESQELLSSITQNISDAIFRRSVTEGLIFVNDAYVKMFGYNSAEEVRRLPPEEFYADPTRRAYIIGLIRRDGKFSNEEIEYRRKDGTAFWGLTSATGIRDEVSGSIVYFDGAIHDITERKQAEQRQAAQYAIVRALASSASLAAAAPQILEAVCQSLSWDIGTLWQADPKILRCVDLWHRPGLQLDAFQIATRESTFSQGVGLPGRIWITREPTWISDVTADRNFPRSELAIECGLHGAFGFPICLGKRVLGVIEFFSHEIRKPDTEILEMFSAIGSQIGQFIERKRAEQDLRSLNKDLEGRVSERTAELVNANSALRDSEGRYRTVTEHAPAAIVVLDTEAGKFIEVNENAVRLFGMSRDELLEVGPADVSPPFQPDGRLSAEAARAKIGKALRGSTPVFEWIHRRGDGKDIPCEVRVARMPAAGRELIVGAITDITARKKAEAELQSALTQERELSQLKTNFVNVVSHEFRTPLGVIMSSADILENYLDRLRPEQRAGHLQDIRYATRQMTGLMEEVLLLGRVESGKMKCQAEMVDIPATCRRLLDEQQAASGRKCPISLEIKPYRGEATADETLLRHILSNLLSNAVKYSAAGKPVSFVVRRGDDNLVFEIRDHGIGIPDEDQKRLFEAFHRARNVGEIPGSGLGLVIVKRCVDLHGGTIECSSKVGTGTTFVVRFKAFGHATLPAAKSTKRRTSAKPLSKKQQRQKA